MENNNESETDKAINSFASKEERDRMFTPIQKAFEFKRIERVQTRSHLKIIIEQLRRVFQTAGLRFCIMSHGPVPLEDGMIELCNKKTYDAELMAWLITNLDVAYGSSPMELIDLGYAQLIKEEVINE